MFSNCRASEVATRKVTVSDFYYSSLKMFGLCSKCKVIQNQFDPLNIIFPFVCKTCSFVQSLTLCHPMELGMPGSVLLILSLLKLMFIELVDGHPTISLSVSPSTPASIFLCIRIFSIELLFTSRGPKYLESAYISPSMNDIQG